MLEIEPYSESLARHPKSGRHILAQFDDKSVVVYQAYRPAIADYAVAHQRFGAGFSYDRMSWIKPGFLWMMFRSGWSSKEGQERVLAIRITRGGFDGALALAVWSTFEPQVYGSHADWKAALSASPVRLQWDPDHGPTGNPLSRRAIQIGLSGRALRQYAEEWTVSIEDVTGFVREQAQNKERERQSLLSVPKEDVYMPADQVVAKRLLLDA